MRLGLRLTSRQTEGKSTDKAADGADKPADSGAAEPGKSGPTADNPAGGISAVDGDGSATAAATAAAATATPGAADTADLTADGNTTVTGDTLVDGDTAAPGNDLADVNTAIAGEVLADVDASGTESKLAGAGPPAAGGEAADGTGPPAADGTAPVAAVGAETAELDTGRAAEQSLDTGGAAGQGKEGQTAVLPAPAEAPAAPGPKPGRLRRIAGQPRRIAGRLGKMLGLGVAADGLRRLGASKGMRWLGAGATRIARLWAPGPGVREASDPGGRTFAMLTALPSLLLIAWLLPGLVLLLSNSFVPAAMVLIAVPLAVALMMLTARQIPGRWPAPDSRPAGTKKRARAWSAWWGLVGTIAVAVTFAIWQIVEKSPQLIVSRDPGAYTQIAYWIADHGLLPIPASLAAFGGLHPGLSFASFGFSSHGASVVPGLTAGLPIVLAVGLWAHGIAGATVISPVIGALAVLAVGGLTGRLAGPQWAPAGALLLAITVPEIYTSRSAFSDTLAQALLFGGLCLIVDSFSSRRPLTLAALGGLSLGLTVMAGTGMLLVLLAVIPVGGALLAGRRPQAIPLCAGVVAGVVCGVAAAIGLDFPALGSTTPSFGIIGILAAGLALLTAVGVTVGLVGPVRLRARKWLGRRPLRWLPDAAAVIVVLAAIGLAIRPYLGKARGSASAYVAALQRLESLPVDPGRLYAENSMYWVIWYLGVPALLLGIIGLAMVTRLCVRALITWRDTDGVAQAWAFPVAIIGWGLFAALWQPGTVPDQPWASRRLIPVILPGLVVLAVWVAAWLIGRAHARGAGVTAVAVATACFVTALSVPATAITFGVELSRPASQATRTALSGLAFRRTGGGELGAVERLCGAIPSHSSVLLLDEPAARAFAEVIRGTCDEPTGIVAGTPTGNVDMIVSAIERAGRHPVLLATKESELVPYGTSPSEIVNLATQQDSHLLTRPPTSTWPVHYVLWMSAPSGTVNGT